MRGTHDLSVGHVHTWAGKRFIDGCHYVVIEKTCKTCGAVHEEKSIRDFGLNALQVAFARLDCERCRQMLKGFEPSSWSQTDGGKHGDTPVRS